MSVTKHFITEFLNKAAIDEFLQKKLVRAGYGGVTISKTPLGTHMVVYAMRPGLVIGRGGGTIKALANTLEEEFNVTNPQISVSEIEFPELNPNVMASRIAGSLQRGTHFRRTGFWALNRIMEAGALGVEIIISGKLRTDRARTEKFRAGYLPKCGEPTLKYMRKAEVHVQLKPGILGVRVRIIPPDAQFPDRKPLIEAIPLEEEKPEEPVSESQRAEEKPEEPVSESQRAEETKEVVK
jgi:small subunit ribosomal protein S3